MLELPGIEQLQGRSFQHLQVPQPVKLGGCGLRSLEETRYPAFIGGLEQALPFMVDGEQQQHPLSTQRVYCCWLPNSKGVPSRLGGDEGRGNGHLGLFGGRAKWRSHGQTGRGRRRQCRWFQFHSDQDCATERGDAAPAVFIGSEQTS